MTPWTSAYAKGLRVEVYSRLAQRWDAAEVLSVTRSRVTVVLLASDFVRVVVDRKSEIHVVNQNREVA